MNLVTTITEAKLLIRNKKSRGASIGFVPTMGALHEGHLQLIRRSCAENDFTVCSIFVNPIQFNNPEDLKKYPRTLDRDEKLLDGAGCDLIFVPGTDEMYPDNQADDLDIDFGMLDKVMEGKYRPGHFKGVAVVVKKLFEIVAPDRAYFGKKDFQQLAIIQHLVKSLSMPVTIVPCNTVREPDGLAMSSRNMRLSASERLIAPRIYEVLSKVKDELDRKSVAEVKIWATRSIEEVAGLSVEYFEISDQETLLPIQQAGAKDRAVAFVAVKLGEVRLIDNIELFS